MLLGKHALSLKGRRDRGVERLGEPEQMVRRTHRAGARVDQRASGRADEIRGS